MREEPLSKRRGKGLSLLAAVAVTAGLLVTGCQSKQVPEGGIRLSYVDPAYLESGQGQSYLEVETEWDLPEESRYLALLERLREPPEGAETALKETLRINKVNLSPFGGNATVDFAAEGLTGSSLEERLLVEQVARTLMRTFPNIASVQFTVDGRIRETLMGHMDTELPYVLQPVDRGGVILYDVEAQVDCGPV